ncbi:autotransporter-associated beta strand repeat-containing protein [uncultured Brevundimonas sp.]|uniref:autotransporter-associated beta strand repeat-containing protein n=1 Tax=uncultured Brevundimonas sp. TaxID=213418 RepID=UPI00261138D1|nr:autotransporter-associated beta strand repeat-containing protein [uncultured Brevundimonas sp.]
MPHRKASISRAYLQNSTALDTARGKRDARSGWRERGLASAVAAVLGTGILAFSGQAFAQDVTLDDVGDDYDISTLGARTIGALNGIAGTSVTLGANTLTTDSAVDSVYGGTIRGAGDFIKTGAGTLTLTGTNTYTGRTTVAGGTLALGLNGSISASSGLSLAPGGQFDISASTTEQSVRSLTGQADTKILLGSNTLTVNAAQSGIYHGVISGTGSLVKTGAVNLTLAGENTYTGDTVVQEGYLQIGAYGTTGSVAGNIVNNATVYFLRSDDYTYGGVISGTGAISQNFTSTLTLTGANTYTGRTGIFFGTIAIGAGGSLSDRSIVSFSNADTTFDISAATTAQAIGGLSGTYGSVILGSNDLTVNSVTSTTFNGTISGSGGLIKNGTGRLTLSGANTYSGGTVINGGTLALSQSGTLNANSALSLDGAASVFNISASNVNQTLGELSGVAGSEIILGSRDLNILQSTNTTFAGVISGTGSVSAQGTGVLTLTREQAYTGSTVISDGTLAIAGNGSLAHSSGIRLVAGTGTFDISAANANQTIRGLVGLAGDKVVLGSRSLTVNTDLIDPTDTFNGTISGSGSLATTGTGTLRLRGSNTYTGATNINGGTLALQEAGSISASSGINLTTAGAVFDIAQKYGGTTIGSLSGVAGTGVVLGANDLTINQVTDAEFRGVINGIGSITKSGNGTLTLLGNNTYTGNTVINAGALAIGNGGTTGAIASSIETNSLVTFNRSDNYTFTGGIYGTGSLTKAGAGTLTLRGVLSYGGQTLIENGTLALAGTSMLSSTSLVNLASAGTALDISNGLPSISIGALTGVSGSELKLGGNSLYVNQRTSQNFAGSVTGTGGIVKVGSGTLYLTGDNTYSGGTVISGGTLSIGNGGTTGSIASSLTNNSAVVFNRSDDFTYAGSIAGVGNLTKQGAGTLTLTGRHTYYGQTYVNEGRLEFAGEAGSGPMDIGGIDVASGATLGFSSRGTASVGGEINLQDGTTLSIRAGNQLTALRADSLVLGQNTTFNLSGIGDEARLPLTLVSTLGGITGDFASVTVGGFAGSVDYMTVHTGKSADGLSYTANYGLSWSANNNLAHGTFTLTDATNSFTLGTALANQTANAATGWNGTSLTKAGAGTLILTGDNTYTGGTTISGGTLQLGNQTATGSVLGNIVNNGTLWIDRTGDNTFSNTVSGSGGLVYSGGDTLTLTGNNSYSGGTRVLAGTLSVSDNFNLGAESGGVELDGGTLQLTGWGFRTFERALTIGTNGGAIDIDELMLEVDITSDITGGVLTKRGAGMISLSGNNRYGGLRVEQGIVFTRLDEIAGDIEVLSPDSALGLAHTDTTYLGTISGDGFLGFNGSGHTTLGSDNSGFTGRTFVSGSLIVGTQQHASAKLGGSVIVEDGGLLGGSGTIGSGAGSVITIHDGATLSPGNSIGALTIDGDLVLAGGSILNVELGTAGSALGSASTNDRVDVTGNLTLGGTLNLTQSADASDGNVGYGYYRLATYGGTLTNNGLSIGNFPAVEGGEFQILTTSAGAVDLFIAAFGDQSLQHWQGGDGVWNGTNAQWHNHDGQLASTWGGNTAVFRNAQGGNIAVEGAVFFEGLQFVDDGFSLIGSGLLEMGSDGAEIRVLANSANIATSIIGASGITKTQAGTLILSGYNVYNGGTTITGGTVSVSRDENLGAASGGVTLNGGTLQVTGTDFGTLSRGITIGDNGGAIDVADAAHTLTVTSAITGGNLIKRGAGTLALIGSNAYGNTSIEQGAMTGSLSNFGGDIRVSAGATLNLNQTFGMTFNGAFGGQGTININGDGYTLLTWDNSAFAGTTNLNGGTLLIGDEQSAGRLGGSLNVASGALLGGSGIIGSGSGSLVTIGTGATLSPGDSIGMLVINGDLKFEDGARYVVEVNPLGLNSDKLIVTGTATLNGGTVAHIGATGTYNPRSTYTILDAGTLTGAFGSVTSDFAFLNPKLVYDYAAGTVDLELVRNDRDFASLAQTRNQSATANAIESIGYAAGHAVYDAVVQLADDAEDIRRSFDQLSGELHGSVRSTLIEDSRLVRNAANDRLRAAFGQSAGDQAPVLAYAANGDQVAVDATYEGAALWAQGYGSWGSFDADASSIELDRQTAGALIGGDVRLGQWRVGAIAGFGQSDIDTDGQRAVIESRTLGVYAGSQWGKASLRLAMAQSWHDVDASRSVQLTGLADYVEGEYSATTRQAFAEIGYELISRDSSQLEAFANVAQVRARTDAFGETGGAAALDIAKADNDVTFTTLGLRGSRQIELGETAAMLRGSAGWRSASGDLSVEGLHAFSAGGAFAVAGAPIAKDAAVIETGVDVRFNATTTFGLTYTGQIADKAQDHGFNARLNIRF